MLSTGYTVIIFHYKREKSQRLWNFLHICVLMTSYKQNVQGTNCFWLHRSVQKGSSHGIADVQEMLNQIYFPATY